MIPKKAHPCMERRHMAYRSSKSAHLCAHDEETKKKERLQWHETTHVVDWSPILHMGSLRGIVLSIKFLQNWLSSFQDVGSKFALFVCFGHCLIKELVLLYKLWYTQAMWRHYSEIRPCAVSSACCMSRTGFWWLRRLVLCSSDDWGRANCSAYFWLHWHHFKKGLSFEHCRTV